MSHPERHGPKKRPVKITVDHLSKPSDYRRAAKLLEHKGLEFAMPESAQHDVFEAVALAAGGTAPQGKTLFAQCLHNLRSWAEARKYPKDFEYLADVKPFTDFYTAFPGHILFEGVT